MRNLFFYSIAFLLLTLTRMEANTSTKVKTPEELKTAIKNAKAGDEIILANGIWKDIQIRFYGNGTKEAPIVLRAETYGKVTIEGQSDLKIGGAYLEVQGLYFKNGFTPTETIIEFRIDSKTIANYCVVSDCVIENYTQLNRNKGDHWVEFWGRNNQLKNCYLAGKSNTHPTVMVNLEGNENIKNYHQISNNYFGPRPRKGGPHGETIQIGNSFTSMVPSHTLVANNLFEQCDGEIEIISNKSNDNIYRSNIFYKSEGSLVLRHGNYCTIDSNIFIGDNKSEFMGGIRVINTGHWITNNYFYNIKGKDFRSAIAVMNGVPKSPQNRYNQVTDVVIAYNTFVDCITPLQFSVGANMDKSNVLPLQEIRSARPTRTIVANNTIYNRDLTSPTIKSFDKIDGITFKSNITNTLNSDFKEDGILHLDFSMTKISDWMFVPTVNQKEVFDGFEFETIKTDMFGKDRNSTKSIGAIMIPNETITGQINTKEFGATWFTPSPPKILFKTIKVTSEKELIEAITKATAGTSIVLKKGTYNISTSLMIDKKITIQSKDKKNKAILIYKGQEKTPAFLMAPKGNLTLDNIILKGEMNQDAFATKEKEMSTSYNLKISNTEITNFNSVLNAYKDSFSDTISIDNSIIKNCKRGIHLASENDDLGEYNAEFVYITNTTFDKIKNGILNYYRGGYDESAIGGNLVFEKNSITNCGPVDESGILIKTRGIVNVRMAQNTFSNNAIKFIAILWGEKDQKPIDNTITNSGEFKIEQNLQQKIMY
jgi:poly(beta-D-mannuronate) lyase